jgi:hypothetical protein
MKTFKSLFYLAGCCILFSACDKSRIHASSDDTIFPVGATVSAQTSGNSPNNLTTASNLVPGEQNIIPANISFCSPMTVPLCSKTGTIGGISVKKGSDAKVYISYTLFNGWYFTGLSLFTGDAAALPMYKNEPVTCSFPFQKTFAAPYTTQVYTFVLNHLPSSFMVAAFASVAKVDGNKIRETSTAWGNGCAGQLVSSGVNTTHDNNGHHFGSGEDEHDFDQKNKKEEITQVSEGCRGGTWATLFSYSAGECIISPVEPDICSNSIGYYFSAADTTFNFWRAPTVTVAGYAYTEEEAEKISNTPNNSGLQDSKHGFRTVATLKLSYCDYTLSPTLAPAVNTIEDWLRTKGKLSPSNLPTGNSAVKNAADQIAKWIEGHGCAIEE